MVIVDVIIVITIFFSIYRAALLRSCTKKIKLGSFKTAAVLKLFKKHLNFLDNDRYSYIRLLPRI